MDNRFISNQLILAAGLIFLCVALSRSEPKTTQIYEINAGTLYLCINAVNYTAKLGEFVKEDTVEHWGGNSYKPHMWVPGFSEKPSDPEVSHPYDVNGSVMTYYIYANIPCSVLLYLSQYYLDGGQNSYWYRFDNDTTWMSGNNSQTYYWYWYSKASSYEALMNRYQSTGQLKMPSYGETEGGDLFSLPAHQLTAGLHKLHIICREPSSKICQLLLRINGATSPPPPIDAIDLPETHTDWSPENNPTRAYQYESTALAPPALSITGQAGSVTWKGNSYPCMNNLKFEVTPPSNVTYIQGYLVKYKAEDTASYATYAYNGILRIDGSTPQATALPPGRVPVGYVKAEIWSFNEMYELSATSTICSLYIGQAPSTVLPQQNTNIAPDFWFKSSGFKQGSGISFMYRVGHSSSVQIAIYALLGNRIRTLINGDRNAGTYRVNWDGLNSRGIKTAASVYFCNMKAGNYNITKKFVKP